MVIHNFYEFVQWCFRDEEAGFVSITVLGIISECIIRVVKVIFNKSDDGK